MKMKHAATHLSLGVLLCAGCPDSTEPDFDDAGDGNGARVDGGAVHDHDGGELPHDGGLDEEEWDLTFQTEFGSMETLEVLTDGIFAIWWDPAFDHAADTTMMFAQLNEIRNDCLDNLGMADPPNPAAGYYYNVYIHHGPDDLFPEGWGNGQGTDRYGMPFLTLPDGAHTSESNLYHEGFHIFQYSANSPGFEYVGDSQWYIEATAQWYQSEQLPDDVMAFVEAGAITANPHLALWHSFSNEAPGDPTDWLYQVRQYGMHTYLFYLTSVAGVSPDIMTNGFYLGTDLSPQEYHYDQVGGDVLRGYFADWAAHNTGGLDYLTPAQVERALLEVELVGDPNNLHPYVETYVDEGTTDDWVRPSGAYTARGWAYNVVRIQNSQAATYTFLLKGDSNGSSGTASHFEGRMVVMSPAGPSYSDLVMADALEGEGTVTLNADDSEAFFVIVSVPEHFGGYQTFGYDYKIVRQGP